MVGSAKKINDWRITFRRIRSAEQSVFYFLVFLNIVTAVVIGYSGIYLGDAVGHTVSADIPQQVLLTIGVVLCYLTMHLLIPDEKAAAKRIKPAPYATFCIAAVLSAGILLGAAGFLTMGYGVAGNQSNAAFGFIFRLLPYNLAAILLVASAPFKKRYILLYLAYSALTLAMGWTAFIANTFFILIMRWHASKQRSRLFSISVFFVLVLAFFVAPYLYMMKFFLRYGSFNVPYLDTLNMPYIQSLAMLLGRITSYGNTLFVSESIRDISGAIQNYSGWSQPFTAPILAIVPRGLIGMHLETFETVLVYVIYGTLNPGISFILTTPGKVMVLWNHNPLLAGLFVLEVIGLLKLAYFMINRICGLNGRYMCMLAAAGLSLSGSLEEFGYLLYGLGLINILQLFAMNIAPILKHWNRVPYDQPPVKGIQVLLVQTTEDEGGN